MPDERIDYLIVLENTINYMGGLRGLSRFSTFARPRWKMVVGRRSGQLPEILAADVHDPDPGLPIPFRPENNEMTVG